MRYFISISFNTGILTHYYSVIYMLISPMTKMYWLVILLLTGFGLSAQEYVPQIPDSLKNKSFETLKEQFYNYEFKDLRITQTYAETMLALAIENENPSQIHQAEHYIARVSTELGNKEKALQFINKALPHSEAANDSTYIIKNLFLKAKIYADFGEYKKAIDYYVNVRNLIKDDPNQMKFHIISHNIALIKNQIGDVRNAIEISKKNLQYFQSKGEKDFYSQIINRHMILASAYSKLAIKNENKPALKKTFIDSSMVHIRDGIKKSKTYNDAAAHAMLEVAKGINYYELNEYERCLNILKATEKEITTLQLEKELPLTYLFQGKAYFSLQQYTQATVYLQKALKASETLAIDFPFLQEILILLAKSYEQLDDAENTIKFYKLFYEKDTQNDLMKDETTETLYEKYDIPSLENKIQNLEEQSQIKETKYKYVKYIALLLLCVLLISGFFYKKRQYQFKKRFDKLLVQINTLEQQQQETSPKEITKGETHEKETPKKQLKIPDEKVVEILKRLKKFEEKEQFLSNKCTLNYVAKKLHTNSTYFSVVLRTHKKKKFIQYITDLRIDYALQRLKNDTIFRSYDIKSIATEVGFNTAESFSKAFRKRTGIYPSFYVKNLDKLNDSNEK